MKTALPPTLLMVVLGVIALANIWAQQAWLAPSLGSAAFAQMMSPEEPSARPYSIFFGQIIGVIAGFIGVFASGSIHVGAPMGSHDLTAPRVTAVVIAVALAFLGQTLSKATTPAGGASAIGAESADATGALRLLIGIVLVTVLGEAARRCLLAVTRPTDTRQTVDASFEAPR